MAWNQGFDLFGYENNRVLQMCEYVAKYNLGNDVQYTTYSWYDGTNCGTLNSQTTISSNSRGGVRPCWALIYNHYAALKGVSAPYSGVYANLVSPEGGGGDYGSTSGGFDQLGFGTLAYTLQPGPLPHGIYNFTNKMSSKNVDNGNTTALGSPVIQYTPNPGNTQQWTAVPANGGSYALTSRMSGLNLDNGGSTATGSGIVQDTVTDSPSQMWNLAPASGGTYTLTNQLSGLNLDNADTTADSSHIIQNTPTGGNTQLWQPTWVGPYQSGY
jgi:hypothetical protein